MCTVTAIPTPRGARIVCNRDELRARPQSLPQVLRTLGRREAVMPIDPQSGGTWIGANDAGLVACLLNATPARSVRTPRLWDGRRSRGEIVPALLSTSEVASAIETAFEINPLRYPPFRLLVLGGGEFFIATSDGEMLTIAETAALNAPIVLTSSGLGDLLVEPLRHALFRREVGESRKKDLANAQDRFHRHQWVDRPHLSVLMSRPEARTVSRTSIELRDDSVTVAHMLLDDALAPVQDPAAPLELAFALTGVRA